MRLGVYQERRATAKGVVTIERGRRVANDPTHANKLRERITSNSVKQDSGCWLWSLQLQGNGYGSIRAFGRVMPAHRASFLVFKGEIPPRMEVGHSCHIRNCVNPEHLQAMTHAENMRQMFELRYRRKEK